MGGDMQVGGVQFPEHPPPLHNLPPFPKEKGTGAPLTLVLLSSNLPPPPQYPPPPFSQRPPPLNKICENSTTCSGDFLSQGWTCSGSVKVKI